MAWKPLIEPGTLPNVVLVSVEDDATENMVCECYCGTDQERIGYANLIAAAPELLEALQEMVNWYGARDIDDVLLPPRNQNPEIAEAMTAIAKATGGAA